MVTPNPPTRFKAFENSGFILQLGLPVCCHQGCLTYRVAMAWLPLLLRELGLELQAVFYSLCMSFQSLMLFICPVTLFMVSSALPLSRIVCLLLPRFFSFTKLHEGGF